MLGGVDETVDHGRLETDKIESLNASAADVLFTERVQVRRDLRDQNHVLENR